MSKLSTKGNIVTETMILTLIFLIIERRVFQEVPQWQNQGAPRHSSASYQNAVAVSSQSSLAAPPARPLTASSQAIPSMALPPFYSQSFNTWQPSQMPAAPLPSSTSNTVPFSSYQPHSQHSAPPVCTVTQTSPSAPSSGVQPSNNQGNQAFQGLFRPVIQCTICPNQKKRIS